jgi:hypothetical protein
MPDNTYWLIDGQWRRPGDSALGRDAFTQPYAVESFWNMPIGSGATTVPLGFVYTGDNEFANGRIAVAEDNVLCLDPDAPLEYIMETDAGWTGAIRCDSRTGDILTGNGSVSPMPQLPIPSDFVTEPYIGQRPNMSGALVYRDGSDIKIFETQPLHICSDGVAVSQFVNDFWVGDSLYTGGLGDKGGSHGGSFLSALGGTIRLGEMLPGSVIPHAMKLSLDTSYYCSPSGGQGHRWPATVADAAWASVYGTNNPSVPDDAKMGMLLTIPEDFDVDALVSEPAQILARAMRDYGAYLCDGDANAAISWYCAWHVEMSNEGFFVDEFRATWGYEFFHRRSLHGAPSPAQMQWRADVGAIMLATEIVTNNSEANPGGPGATRRAPLAPPLVVPP